MRLKKLFNARHSVCAAVNGGDEGCCQKENCKTYLRLFFGGIIFGVSRVLAWEEAWEHLVIQCQCRLSVQSKYFFSILYFYSIDSLYPQFHLIRPRAYFHFLFIQQLMGIHSNTSSLYHWNVLNCYSEKKSISEQFIGCGWAAIITAVALQQGCQTHLTQFQLQQFTSTINKDKKNSNDLALYSFQKF